MAKVIIANASTIPDIDYYFSGFSKDGSIVHLSRYFDDAVFFNDDELLQTALMECYRFFGYADCVEFCIEEVEL